MNTPRIIHAGPMPHDTILPPRPLGRMSEGRASKLRPGSALVDPRFSLMDLSTSPTSQGH